MWPRIPTKKIEAIQQLLIDGVPVPIIAKDLGISRYAVGRIKRKMPCQLRTEPIRFHGDLPPQAIIIQARIYRRTEKGIRERAFDGEDADLALSPPVAARAAVEHVRSLEKTLDRLGPKLT